MKFALWPIARFGRLNFRLCKCIFAIGDPFRSNIQRQLQWATLDKGTPVMGALLREVRVMCRLHFPFFCLR